MALFRSLILYEHYFFELLVYTTVEMFSYLLHVVLVEQLKHRESEHFAANKKETVEKSKTFLLDSKQTISFHRQTLNPTAWYSNLIFYL